MSKQKKNAESVKSETESFTSKPLEVKSISSDDFAFGKSNFTIMLIGVAIIAVGFLIMTMDKEEFGFGFLGITLGPIIVFIGFMIEFFAILKKKS